MSYNDNVNEYFNILENPEKGDLSFYADQSKKADASENYFPGWKEEPMEKKQINIPEFMPFENRIKAIINEAVTLMPKGNSSKNRVIRPWVIKPILKRVK